ncbi:MAG TPA: type IV secretion system protein [Frateuria sp.]|uniref:virB8 family protein n=1 Tax=Frateuria sp. TaxID=2211372 RepID=UPI002D806685|nr:type IV secretion system protein [Frateuria sp.]HET6806333.1 type IV secretion system protein [Frateuria sp.]
MRFSKNRSDKVEDAVRKAVNYELSIADIARRSERRAWRVAFGAVGMSLILASGYFYMLPLKRSVPYLVMADAYTGTSTVARLTGDFTHRRVSTSEAINRSNVAHFVMARESYDLALLNLGDWTTVQTMASPGVKADYTRLYSPMNPDSPYKTYGKDKAVRVKLLSIVLIGSGPGRTPTGATVRFQRSLYDKRSGVTQPLDSKIATMEFTYKANLEMDDRNRIENPLGFWVTSYRVDNDYATPAPAEVAGAANAQTMTRPTSPVDRSVIPPPPEQGSGAGTDAGSNAPASGAGR